ncbi:MAG: HTH-type transcriptional activator Btr [Planctomycetota bacterium]|jgi:AraC-like DNA-binding protein
MDAGPVLWDLACWGRQVLGPGQPYAWDNRRRTTRDRVDCQVTLRGRLRWRDASGERSAGPGTVLLFRHGDPTAYGRAPDDRGTYACRWVELHGAGLMEHWAWLTGRTGPVVSGRAAAAMAAALDDLLRVAERAGRDPLARQAAVQRFVSALVAAAEAERRRAGRPVDLAIDQAVREPERCGSVADLARAWGVSREHLCRAFRDRLGMAPAPWLARRRLDSARLLLEGTALAADEVARQAGFSSAVTLRRALRAAGLPAPARWRRR